MKYFFIGLSLILFASCKKQGHVVFTGSTPGIKSGTFVVKNLADSTLYGVNIKDEKFQADGILQQPGYYKMDIVNDADKSTNENHFEIYLEDGKYSIQTEAGKARNYPKIESASKTENELSAYYGLIDQQLANYSGETGRLNAELDSNKKSPQKYKKLVNSFNNKLFAASVKAGNVYFDALKIFVKKYPQSSISAHLMANLDYTSKPVEFYDVYKQFSPEAKNSDDGKEIDIKLSHLVKLVPGAQSPVIEGKMPDGKAFDPSTIKKKLILIDFWRAANQISRSNHLEMINLLSEFKDKNVFGVVSVSIDSKMDWWTSAIKEDKLTWPQVSDLKGDDSKNAVNWAIGQIPTYYLLDGDWKIIARDIQIQEVRVYIKEYLDKH